MHGGAKILRPIRLYKQSNQNAWGRQNSSTDSPVQKKNMGPGLILDLPPIVSAGTGNEVNSNVTPHLGGWELYAFCT